VQPLGGVQLVAESDMQVVGYICCAVTQGGVFLKEEIRRHGYIHNVVVSPAAKRQGIGEALMRAAETFCRGQGIKSLVLSHVVGNDGAARLYDKLGITHHAIERSKRLD
jgi:ribosomal protein S18 acetylase RimI-like enzyme